MNVQPIDVVALVQVFFTGLAAVLGGIAAVFGVIAAARAKRAEVSTALLERNTNSLTDKLEKFARQEGVVEGERKGVQAGQESARQLAEGRRQGVETERAAVAAANQGEPKLRHEEKPVPVADDRTAVATERIAAATEKKSSKRPGPRAS